jgi:hypothetical protein
MKNKEEIGEIKKWIKDHKYLWFSLSGAKNGYNIDNLDWQDWIETNLKLRTFCK